MWWRFLTWVNCHTPSPCESCSDWKKIASRAQTGRKDSQHGLGFVHTQYSHVAISFSMVLISLFHLARVWFPRPLKDRITYVILHYCINRWATCIGLAAIIAWIVRKGRVDAWSESLNPPHLYVLSLFNVPNGTPVISASGRVLQKLWNME